MRAKIERWQGALAHAWVGIWAASAAKEWRAPRQGDATPPSAQFRRIPLGPKFFRPGRRRIAGPMQPHRAAHRSSSEAKKPQVSRSTRVLQQPASDPQQQHELAWRNIFAILEAADMSRSKITEVTAYVTNHDRVETYRIVRDRMLEGARPVSTLIVAGLADPNWKVEIAVTAAKTDA